MRCDENEKSFGPRDINTGFNDRSYPARRKAKEYYRDASGKTNRRSLGTLLNPRSANSGAIARSGALIRSTIFMLVAAQGGGGKRAVGKEGHIGGFNAT